MASPALIHALRAPPPLSRHASARAAAPHAPLAIAPAARPSPDQPHPLQPTALLGGCDAGAWSAGLAASDLAMEHELDAAMDESLEAIASALAADDLCF